MKLFSKLFFVIIFAALALETLVCSMRLRNHQIDAPPQPATCQAPPLTKLHVRMSAYNPDDPRPIGVGPWAFVYPRRTSANTDAEKPGLGADFGLIPRGTRIRTPNFGVLVVDDTGGAARQLTQHGIIALDVRMPRHADETNDDALQRAKNFGVQWEEVEILPPVSLL